ncbi:MAG: hypothetical protein HY221_00080 [Candidatus Sungbacteria bacterium]|uniref:Uncharacterized protein n=1 Tax=Candidatus Sungiibacteriota bacterium TaxID=2750080 RepID=A0A932QYA9_9BACT|nr:hypothetical protein [Candidatus Sungbacteria bacterium]
MEKPKSMEGAKDDNEQVSREELLAHGIKGSVSMTREELNRHLETLRLRASVPGKKEDEAMFEDLTDEQINRAEEAAKKRQELGR